jgi:NADPH:quinone reductase-like Zn-dependent oxidoreductase
VVKHPSTLSFEEAVAIWNPFITPWGAFAETGLVKPGNAVVIPAASSSVGLDGTQIVNALGAVSIALTRTAAKRAELLEAGAKHVIVTEEQDVVTETLKLTDGRGAPTGPASDLRLPNFTGEVEIVVDNGRTSMIIFDI